MLFLLLINVLFPEYVTHQYDFLLFVCSAMKFPKQNAD